MASYPDDFEERNKKKPNNVKRKLKMGILGKKKKYMKQKKGQKKSRKILEEKIFSAKSR